MEVSIYKRCSHKYALFILSIYLFYCLTDVIFCFDIYKSQPRLNKEENILEKFVNIISIIIKHKKLPSLINIQSLIHEILQGTSLRQFE